MKARILISLLAIFAVVGLSVFLLDRQKAIADNSTFNPPPAEKISAGDLPRGEVKESKIEQGDTFVGIMSRMGVRNEDSMLIIDSAKDVFDLTKIRAGKTLKLVFANEALAAVEYQLSNDDLIHVKKQGSELVASKEEVPYAIEKVSSAGIVTDSLFDAGQKAGMSDRSIIEMTDAFSGVIDFATETQEGDKFSVVYERRALNGIDSGTGRVLFAEFTTGGKSYRAFRFGEAFYDENGRSLARQFLRSPLNYARISSGFSYSRKNPVTKQVTPHRAIDYAANSGTPVIATGKGKVITAGSKGGLGITVEIRHGNYMTQYAHLSKLASGLSKGDEVDQGQIVGYVGSTGISTGPHLQYAMFNSGSPVNPLALDAQNDEVLSAEKMGEFNSIRDQYIKMIELNN
jgi:murein DD-endopeptidase MepM/ murein hydrolase activator NlpD